MAGVCKEREDSPGSLCPLRGVTHPCLGETSLLLVLACHVRQGERLRLGAPRPQCEMRQRPLRCKANGSARSEDGRDRIVERPDLCRLRERRTPSMRVSPTITPTATAGERRRAPMTETGGIISVGPSLTDCPTVSLYYKLAKSDRVSSEFKNEQSYWFLLW